MAVALVAAATPLAAQPEAPESWLRVESAHFVLYTDAEAERGAEIVLGLEQLRQAFARLSPAVALRSPVPTRTVAFRDGDSYAGYKTVPDRGSLKLLGQFLAHRDGNFITLDADPRYLGALATIYHEYVHELVQHNFPGVPLWFNEGLAEYYSTFAVEGGYAFVGRPVERHLRWLRTHPRFSVAEVLAATRESAAEHDGEAAGQLYAVSWALVHYLLSGDRERLDRVAELLFLLNRGEEAEGALMASFGLGSETLAETLREYLLGPLPQAGWRLGEAGARAPTVTPAAPADVLVQLGDLLLRLERLAEADRHYELALAYDGFHAGAVSGMAAVRDREARLEEAAVLHGEALELGQASAWIHLRYGRHLLERLRSSTVADQPERLAAGARRAFAEAARLAPDFAECRAMLGAAQLLPGGDPRQGIEELEAVRRLLPRRADVVFNLLHLYLLDDRIAPAATLLEKVLVPLGEVELEARAREAVERSSLLKAARDALAEGEIEEGVQLFDRALEITSDPELRARMVAQRATLRRQAGLR